MREPVTPRYYFGRFQGRDRSTARVYPPPQSQNCENRVQDAINFLDKFSESLTKSDLLYSRPNYPLYRRVGENTDLLSLERRRPAFTRRVAVISCVADRKYE